MSACIEWQGARDRKGYGISWAPPSPGKSRLAHRIAYEREIGPIPEGLVIDHLCRNRACVNTAHLEPVTNRENIMRGVGARAHHLKPVALWLTGEGNSGRAVARALGISHTSVQRFLAEVAS